MLKLDSLVIAGTGSGKTIPFMLPLLAHPEKVVIIISPLKVLQRDQVMMSILFNSKVVSSTVLGPEIQENENKCHCGE